MSKILPKFIECPSITDNDIQVISDLVFRKDDEPNIKSDLIFIFGALRSKENMLIALYTLLDNEVCNKVLISGGINPRRKDASVIDGYSLSKIPESEAIKASIQQEKYPNIQIFTEVESDNTKNNVIFSLNLEGIKLGEAKKIYFISKSHHAGRACLTLKKYLPNTELYQFTYPSSFEYNYSKEQEITKGNWYKNPKKRNIVWGEVIRIYQYGKIQNDIEFGKNEEQSYSALSHLFNLSLNLEKD